MKKNQQLLAVLFMFLSVVVFYSSNTSFEGTYIAIEENQAVTCGTYHCLSDQAG